MKKEQITLSKKIGEIKKLKKLFRKVCSLLNDPVEMKDKALSNKAFKQACDIVQERMLNRSKQCIGFGSRPLLHRSPLHTIDEQRKGVEDAQLREAEKIYRSKDPVYAKAVDQYQAEITNLLTEIENCYYFLQDTFQAYPWIKGTLLAGNFEYFRKNYESINKRWFVGEIMEVLEKLNNIQYSLERELQLKSPAETRPGHPKNAEAEKSISSLEKLLKDETKFSDMPRDTKKESWEWIADKIGYPQNPANTTPRYKIMQTYLRKNSSTQYAKLKSIVEKN